MCENRENDKRVEAAVCVGKTAQTSVEFKLVLGGNDLIFIMSE